MTPVTSTTLPLLYEDLLFVIRTINFNSIVVNGNMKIFSLFGECFIDHIKAQS